MNKLLTIISPLVSRKAAGYSDEQVLLVHGTAKGAAVVASLQSACVLRLTD